MERPLLRRAGKSKHPVGIEWGFGTCYQVKLRPFRRKHASGSLSCLKYLLNQFNARQQVHSEINELPDYAFLLVLFLFQHKHVMVEELLQLLVGEVDAKLLEAVVLNNVTEG